MKGEIEQVWKNETADGRKYEVLQINGARYSLWDEDYHDQFQLGQSIEFDYKESGDFKNISNIQGNHGQGEKEPKNEDKKISKIIKMSSLRSASRILSSSKIPYENRADKTLEIAKKFEKYLNDKEFGEDGD